MQPEPTPPKPAENAPTVLPELVTVSAPKPAPAAEPEPQHMAVAPAPAPDSAVPGPAPGDHSDHAPEPLSEEDAKSLPAPKPTTPPPVQPSGPHAPVGAIIATVIGMLILCGLAVAIYMSSHPSMSM